MIPTLARLALTLYLSTPGYLANLPIEITHCRNTTVNPMVFDRHLWLRAVSIVIPSPHPSPPEHTNNQRMLETLTAPDCTAIDNIPLFYRRSRPQ